MDGVKDDRRDQRGEADRQSDPPEDLEIRIAVHTRCVEQILRKPRKEAFQQKNRQRQLQGDIDEDQADMAVEQAVLYKHLEQRDDGDLRREDDRREDDEIDQAIAAEAVAREAMRRHRADDGQDEHGDGNDNGTVPEIGRVIRRSPRLDIFVPVPDLGPGIGIVGNLRRGAHAHQRGPSERTGSVSGVKAERHEQQGVGDGIARDGEIHRLNTPACRAGGRNISAQGRM